MGSLGGCHLEHEAWEQRCYNRNLPRDTVERAQDHG